MTQAIRGVQMMPSGREGVAPHARGVRYTISHGGNRRIYDGTRDYWECAGCQHFYGTDEVLRMQREAFARPTDQQWDVEG